jgi:hypothetical protein
LQFALSQQTAKSWTLFLRNLLLSIRAEAKNLRFASGGALALN